METGNWKLEIGNWKWDWAMYYSRVGQVFQSRVTPATRPLEIKGCCFWLVVGSDGFFFPRVVVVVEVVVATAVAALG